MLTEDDKISLLNDFPDIKLSYEKITHKKVYNSEYILAIPDGKKCFAWFRQYKNDYLCFILELDNTSNNKIKNIWIATTCFSSSLCYGTVLYGTIFKHHNNQFFCVENIYLNKANDVSGENWNNKLNMIYNLFKTDIKQVSYSNSFLVFGLPVISNSNEELKNKLNNLVKYKIASIQYKKSNTTYCLSYNEFIKIDEPVIKEKEPVIKEKEQIVEKEPNKNIIFEIKPDIQNDIYYLYSLNRENYGIACIPDYKTSIMMNKLFRKIKENNDLDKLEESDDEDEFENPEVDKFVNLDKSFKFICQFNKRFKKWTPIKITDDNATVSNQTEIKTFIDKLFDKSRTNSYKTNNNNYKKHNYINRNQYNR